MRYYLLSTLSGADDDDREWIEQLVRTGRLCEGCNGLLGPVEPVDACLDYKEGAPLSFVGSLAIGTARKSFLEDLGWQDVTENLVLGKVFVRSPRTGKVRELEEYATFRGKEVVYVRGVEEAGFRVCEQCGRVIYFAIPGDGDGVSHVLRSRLASERSIYESDSHDLVVSEKIYDRIKGKKYKKLHIEPLELLDKPLDGIDDPRL
jgi:hypothetical protein